MSENQKPVVNNYGISGCGLLFVALFLAKVLEYGPAAQWSWWFVFSPVWVPVTIVIGVFVVLPVCVALLWAAYDWVTGK